MDRLCLQSGALLAMFLATANGAAAQKYTISARPGLVNQTDGEVYLDNRALPKKAVERRYLKSGDILTSEDGHADVFLAPGVVLHLSRASAIRMISPSLLDTKVELVRGQIEVEVTEMPREDQVDLLDKGASVTVRPPVLFRTKPDLYHLTADPAVVAVISGKAAVAYAGKQVELRARHWVAISDPLTKRKLEAVSTVRLSDMPPNAGGRAGASRGSALASVFDPNWSWMSALSARPVR